MHLDTPADPGEQVEVVAAAGVRDDAQEVTQLKELLLVHLDMISQQQDLIMAKDRQIRALKTEKEAVSVAHSDCWCIVRRLL